MRIKFLRSRLITWYCFHVGSQISGVHPNHHVDHQSRYAAQTVKLIRSDGMVKVYYRPVEAAELMLEFPKHLVCHADSFFIGKKVPPLSEKDRLQLGNKYFLLPRQFFQSVLSFVTIASFVSVDDNSDTASSKKKEFVKKLAAICKPFDILKSPSGNLQIRVSDEFITKLMEEGRLREGGDDQEEEDNRSCKDQVMNKIGEKVCTTPQLKKDYSQLVGFRRSVQWRPKLDTIREKKDRKKISGFGIKKKKMKTQAKIDQQKIRKLEKEKAKKEKKMEKKEKKMEKKEKKKEKKEKKKERKEQKEKQKEEKEIRKKEKEKPASKAPPPPPPLPPPPPSRSSSLKNRWKKMKL